MYSKGFHDVVKSCHNLKKIIGIFHDVSSSLLKISYKINICPIIMSLFLVLDHIESYTCSHDVTFLNVFHNFHVVGSIKSMKHGHSLDERLNYASNNFSCSKF